LPGGLSEVVTEMLNGLVGQISGAVTTNKNAIPGNPHLNVQLNGKIAMLQTASLATDIINNRRWVEGQSASGHVTPIGLVFPMESMRAEATDAVNVIAASLPVLETFFNEGFPTTSVRVWYGFVIGNSGGGGLINSEDRTSWNARATSTMGPFDTALCHELGHSYMPNEALDQFLEVYLYNVTRGASPDPSTWSYTRSWTPSLGSNQGLAAVLDVYQLIGHDTMRAAYRAIRPLRPAYGSALTPAVIEAFVSQVPVEFQAQVRAKLATIIA
jgi:hypothetical protein